LNKDALKGRSETEGEQISSGYLFRDIVQLSESTMIFLCSIIVSKSGISFRVETTEMMLFAI